MLQGVADADAVVADAAAADDDDDDEDVGGIGTGTAPGSVGNDGRLLGIIDDVNINNSTSNTTCNCLDIIILIYYA